MNGRALSVAALVVLGALPASAQTHAVPEPNLYAMVELPALATAVVFCFLTARALRGGRLGNGMALIAWGLLVMAIGHLNMQSESIFGFDLFAVVLGPTFGRIAWALALIVTWTLTGLGFFRLYRASTSV